MTAPAQDSAAASTYTVTEPGIYNLPAKVYHSDPVRGGSLSSTGARKLLSPSCPAKFKHWRDIGEEPNRTFDFGHAAHQRVLGAGPPLTVIDAADYKSKPARDARDAAYAAGEVPVLPHELETVDAMAAVIRNHAYAGPLFDPARGRAEQTLVAQDPETGVMCRALLDMLHNGLSRRGVFLIPDYKTGKSAAPEDLPRVMHQHGYHQQLDWYIDLVRWTGAAGDAPIAGLLVVQEKDPPYLISIAQPDPNALGVARTRNRYAREVYRWCVENDRWPGYGWPDRENRVISLSLPPWVEWQHKDAVERGDFYLTEENDDHF